MNPLQQFLIYATILFLAILPLSYYLLHRFVKESIHFRIAFMLFLLVGLSSVVVFAGSFLSIYHIIWEFVIIIAMIYFVFKKIIDLYKKPMDFLENKMKKYSEYNFDKEENEWTVPLNNQIAGIISSAEKMGVETKSTSKKVTKHVKEIENLQSRIVEKSNKLSQLASNQSQSAMLISDVTAKLVAALTENTKQTKKAYGQVKKVMVKTQINNKNVTKTAQSLVDISAKISVISDIAFQTHLLSLNTAIEASKVHKSGGGFKAISQNIRKLSEQSENSSKEILKMTKKGDAIAKRTLRISGQILPEAKGSAGIVKKISTQGKSQIQEAESINSFVESIRDVSGKIATIAGEVSSIAENIEQKTVKVINETKEFDV
ncbi:MAG: methyl-accepting chemotaxis protein [Bacteroidota bacterium]|nr:methyl-accepting chemotaxis protein [Bacteroidota bacterium]